MEADAVITVLLADDDSRVLEALQELIGDDPSFAVVATASDADEAIELGRSHRPDVAVFDVSMPGGGVYAATELRRLSPGTALVAFSAERGTRTMEAMLAAGVDRYVLKGDGRVNLLATLAEVAVTGRARNGHVPQSEDSR